MSNSMGSKSKSRGRPSKKSATKVERNSQPPIQNAEKNLETEWLVFDKKEEDPCDCPYDNCPGCWYPCSTCGSKKCSPFCRRNRKESSWEQQHIEWRKVF